MADNVTVTNKKTTFDADTNADLPIRTSETAGSTQIQHVRLDLGVGTAEAVAEGTLPVSGTVTANAGTNLNTSALALESGGNLATIAAKDFATQTTLAALNAKVTAVNTGAVVVSSSALPTGAATLAEQQTQTASLSVLDDWDESDRAKVNTMAGPGTVATGTITTIATTSALTLTTEPSALLEISGTYANISIIFEGRPKGSSTYTAVKAYDTTNTIYGTTYSTLTSVTRFYYVNTIGLDSIRVRGLSYTSGTMNTRWVPINSMSLISSVEVVNAISATLTATNFTDTFGNFGPSDGVQLGFQDQRLGDYQRQHGSTNAAWVNPRDQDGNELLLLQEAGNVSIASAVQPAGYTSIGVGNKNVTTAGTRVTLASSTVCKKVVICAKSANTGTIWVGGSTVASGSGIPLVALQQIEIDIANLTTVNIDSTVNGEGVTFLYYN